MELNRARWEKFLIVLGVLMYLLEFPHGIHADGFVRYDALLSFFATGHLQPMLYSYVHPMISAPLLLLGRVFHDGFWWMSRFNTFVFLGTTFYAARSLSRIWSPETVRTFILLMFCATMFPRHVTDYYAEVFSACLVVLAILEFQSGRTWSGIPLICLSVWNTPGTAIAGAGLLTFFAFRSRRYRYFLAVPLLFLGIMGESYLKFGELFPGAYMTTLGAKSISPYYAGPGFSYPFFFGVLSVFLSFGKGLFFFMPGLIGLFHRKTWGLDDKPREFVVAGTAYLAGLVLVFSRWLDWSGDWFWGPRFYLFASILGVMILLVLIQEENLSYPWKVFRFFATALSIWVGCQGVLYGQDFLEDCFGKLPDAGFMCNYVPEFSALWRVFVIWPVPRGRKVAYLIYFLLVAATILWPLGRGWISKIRSEMRTLWRNYGLRSGWRA